MTLHSGRLSLGQKKKPKVKTKSLLIAAQNNTIEINCIKSRIGKTPEYSKCELVGERMETVNCVQIK